MPFVNIVIGALVLFLGRKLFWLFVAVIGFAAGLAIAARLFDVRPEWIALVLGIVLGVVGIVLAIVLQRLAIGVAGFLAGAFIATSLAGALGVERGGLLWLAAVAAGILGALLLSTLFDWALIGLSSLAGATLVIEALHPAPAIAWVGLAGLFVVGAAVQVSMMYREKHKSTEAAR